ncbi:phage major capsid protein, partial [Escherichia coli]|nr:phage major capsid protein [Escherichia coli]EMF1701244.1 phage major capsid protein [Escherichia coli]
VSLFQNDATAFRAITYCGWQKLDKAVTVLAKADFSGINPDMVIPISG